MATINRIPITVTGNTSAITYGTNPKGTPYANFSVAQTAKTFNNQTGRWEDAGTTWIRVVAYGPLAKHMERSGMVKGVAVTVAGWYEQHTYRDPKDGSTRTAYELHANDVAVSLRWNILQITKADDNGNGGQYNAGPNDGYQQPQNLANQWNNAPQQYNAGPNNGYQQPQQQNTGDYQQYAADGFYQDPQKPQV